MSEGLVWVFDTGPLRHFAANGWLGVLKLLAESNEAAVVIPETVEAELLDHRHSLPALVQVLDADWISVDRSTDEGVLSAFSKYEEVLVSGWTNRGECGVLALGKALGYTLIIDDETPRLMGQADDIAVRVTLELLCEGIRERLLTVATVEALADDLLAGDYYLPFEKGGFRMWALEDGGLDWDDVQS